MASARHRAAARRVPRGARGGADRAVPAGRRDAGRPHAARRGFRAARQGAWLAPRALELAPLGRLDARVVRAGPDARALRHRLRFRPRLLALCVPRRREPVWRLRAARRDLAHSPHRGQRAREIQGVGALGPRLGRARRRAGEPRHAAREPDGARALVRLPAHGAPHAAAARHARRRHLCVGTGQALGLETVRRRGGDLHSLLRRPRVQPVSLCADGQAHDLAGSGARERPHLPRRRRGDRAAVHLRLYDLLVPCVPRQGSTRGVRTLRGGSPWTSNVAT